MTSISHHIKRVANVVFYSLPWNYQKRKLQILTEFYQLGADFLNQVGEEYWLDFGTLLGKHRHNDIIPHDLDVDFGMHQDSYEKVLASKHLLPPQLELHDSSHRHHGPKLYLKYKAFDLDLYFYEDLGYSLRSYERTKWPNERQAIPKSLIYPLKPIDFLGRPTFEPDKIQDYLEYIYGYLGSDSKRNKETGFWEQL